MRIMIVDDAIFMRMSIKKIVEAKGHEVVGEASTGEEAIRVYKTEKPDLVFMDITMPDMNGIEALRTIKEFDNGAEIVMVSAMGQQAMVIEAIQLGARDFVVKPFETDRINAVLAKYL